MSGRPISAAHEPFCERGTAMKSGKTLVALTLFTVILAAACERKMLEEIGSPTITKAIAIVHPTEGSSASGTVVFSRTAEGIRIVADIEGLSPGNHGFHIHEYGDCSAPDATSAGGHYNPLGNRHGGPDDEKRHVGDLGNITAGDNGTAYFERIDTLITLNGSDSVVGRAVVVHAGEDDLTSQPSGNAGPRIACGVIGIDAE